jgi:hypothetical protein
MILIGANKMMTRKDYVNTAEILWSIRYAVTPEIHEHLVNEFAQMFATDNPRFDRSRFEQASK